MMLIALVSDNHVDNYLQEILVFVYNSPMVNNRSNENFISKRPLYFV